jgi:hypothetical protein
LILPPIFENVVLYVPNNVFCTLLDATKAFDRVEYVRLFNCLIEKGVCPVVCRFLALLYTNQHIRVRWGNVAGSTFSCLNGVKQGGVMSPILFSIYMDQLLSRLQGSPFGCQVDNVFMGAFAYADDLIILSPTLYGTRCMLEICEEYGQEFNVMFNPSKSKMIIRSPRELIPASDSTSVSFMQSKIDTVMSEKHLGNLFGNVKPIDIVNSLLQDFWYKTNLVKCHFRNLPVNVMYNIFKLHCMPLYGSQLVDLDHKSVKKLYTAWRKSIRFVLNLPYRTHSDLLHFICGDNSIEIQMYLRFLKFYKSLYISPNPVVSTCCQLLITGTGSAVSNSLTKISEHFKIHKYDMHTFSYKPPVPPDEICAITSAIIELIEMRTLPFITYETSPLSVDDCDVFLELLCTS